MEECIFCKIIKGEIPGEKVYEDDRVVAFNDINPAARVHVLIVPREHTEGIRQACEKEGGLPARILSAAAEIAARLDIEKTGYRVLVNSGSDAGQAVNHLHFHLLGGEKLKGI